VEQQAPVAAEEDRTKKESEWDQSDISDIRYFFEMHCVAVLQEFLLKSDGHCRSVQGGGGLL
jgi:hypothetical protein